MPPWAANSFDLTRILRQEMESEYVRENIHKWIDLIFGIDQRNPDKLNLFFPVCYADYHKDNKIQDLFKDKKEYEARMLMQEMIKNIGNMYIAPTKVFKKSLKAIIQKSRRKMDSNSRTDRSHNQALQRAKEEAKFDDL